MRMERGTVIADRYVVSEVLRPWLAEFPDIGSVCLVIDAILAQPAILYGADSAHSGDLLDAARRTALLSDPRIPAVHDVGRFEGTDYVVCERIGAKGLPELLAEGPLDPEAARALIGELATALVHASKRGLHHLCLGPESVALSADGEVVVHGVAIDAAIADEPYELGLDSLNGRESLREDALAIVSILYAVLTAHWPGGEPRAGLPVAERKNNRYVRAGSITPGIPRDLEEFVSGVVTQVESGPRSPSEIVRYLGQWDTRALQRVSQAAPPADAELFPGGQTGFSGSDVEHSQPSSLTHTLGRPAEPGVRPSRKPKPAPRPEDETTHPTRRATPQQLQAALNRIGMSRPGAHGLAAGVLGSGASPFDERMQMRQASTFPISAESLAEAADETPQWQPEDTFSSYSAYASREQDANMTAPIIDRDQADLWQDSEDTQVIELDRSQPAAAEDKDEEDDEDDGSWFLGGMFPTREDELARQRAEFEREQLLQQQAEENARRNLRAARQRRTSDGDGAGAGAGGVAYDLDEPTQQMPISPRSTADGGSGAAAGGSDAAAKKASATPRIKSQQPSAPAQSLKSKGASQSKGTSPAPSSSASQVSSPAAAQPGNPSAGAGNASAGVGGASAGAGSASAGAGNASAAVSDPAQKKKRNSKALPLTVAVVVLLVVIGLIAGIYLRPAGEPTDETADQNPAAPASSPAETAQPDDEPAPVPPAIASAEALDPQGDGEENGADAENVLPGVSGVWQTDRYNSAAFGGLKDGLGLALELEEAATITTVDLISGTPGGQIEIRVGDSADPEDAEVVGTGALPDDTGSIDLDEPATGTHLFVWITELPAADEGFRARISEVAVS